MKNKFIFFLVVFLFFNINCHDIAAEEFFFESEVIEITNDGNKIQAKNGVRISTKNNIEITADESTYDKIKLILSLIGNIKIIDQENNIKISGEDIGDVKVSYSSLIGVKINASSSPYLIDEYPILSIAASQAKGSTIMEGLSELRHKESDRIKSITTNLSKLGFKAISKKDNISIQGNQNIKVTKTVKIKTYSDHRIAMSFLILGLLYNNNLTIDDEACISISYPNFTKDLEKISVKY